MLKAVNCNIIMNVFGQQVEFRIFRCASFKSAVTDGQKTHAKEFKRISFLSRFCQFEYSRVGNVRKRLGILRILLFLIASI